MHLHRIFSIWIFFHRYRLLSCCWLSITNNELSCNLDFFLSIIESIEDRYKLISEKRPHVYIFDKYSEVVINFFTYICIKNICYARLVVVFEYSWRKSINFNAKPLCLCPECPLQKWKIVAHSAHIYYEFSLVY